MAKHNPNLWKEWHWYWLAYWRLHLSYNTIAKIISFSQKLGSMSATVINKVIEFIISLMTSMFSTVLIIALAVFIAMSFIVLIVYSNHLVGCWLGVLVLVPGIGWGSN